MPINSRITGGQKLPHHRLFGTTDTPPLGWAGHEKRFKFSLKDFECEAEAKIKAGAKPDIARREVGREHGHQAWNWLDTFYCATVYVPKNVIVQPPFGSDPTYRFNVKHDRLIAGWWYDRYMSRLGPTNTIAAWIATKIGYISGGTAHYVHRDDRQIPGHPHHVYMPYFNDPPYFLDEPRTIGVNPYTDYKYIGDFPRTLTKEYPEYVQPVIDKIIERFVAFHQLKVSK